MLVECSHYKARIDPFIVISIPKVLSVYSYVLDCKDVPLHLQERLFYVPIQVGFLSDEDKDTFRSMLISMIT